MNGFFYQAEDAGGGARGGGPGQPGGGSDGYDGFGLRGENVQLKLVAKEMTLGREMMIKHVDWAKATVRTIEPIAAPDGLASLHQIGFEIELPVRDLPWLEGARVRTSQPFYMRVIAFFRRTPSAADVAKSKEVITAVLEQNAKDRVLPIDGVARLKREIKQSLGPDELYFYNNYGSNDVMIVQRDTDRSGSERNGG
jgi:hypothetical protein